MDKKKPVPYTGISKTLLKTLNNNYYVEPLKDENRISEIMSQFILGEFDTIETILNSGEILNFKDQTNQTLNHVILKNDNITEEKKLYVIKKLIDEKNVSIHTMTNYNQNPLHLACQKGYSTIISYLIEKGCDQTLIDNYGNTPIHYLVDKFIRECGDNDFYLQTNKQVKLTNSSDSNKINNILKNQSYLILLELLKNNPYSEDIGDSGYRIVNALSNFVSNKVQCSLPLIYELINNKVKDINNIFEVIGDTDDIKFEKAKKIILSINDDIFQIYGLDMEFTNIIWEKFLSEQNLRIKKKKEELFNNIMDDIKTIKKITNTIRDTIKEKFIDENYSHLSRFYSGTFLFYYLLSKYFNVFQTFDSLNIRNVYKFGILYTNDLKGNIKNIGQLIINIKYKKSCDKISEITNNIKYLLNKSLWVPDNCVLFLNGIGNINNLDTINIIKYNYFDNSENDYINFIEGITNISIDGNNYTNRILYIPKETYDEDKLKNNIDNSIRDILLNFKNENKIAYIFSNIIGEKKYFKYSPIRIIIDTIFNIINIIDGMMDNFEYNNFIKFYLFDIKYLSELIFKIINNLVILEKYFDHVNIQDLINTDNEINEHYKKLISDEFPPNFTDILKNLDDVMDFKKIPAEVKKFYEKKEYINKINDLYNKNTDILDKLTQLTKNINQYFSYDQLEKYNEFLSINIKSKAKNPESIEIPNTILNNYSFKIKYPTYNQYKNDYFNIKINLYDLGCEKLNDRINPNGNLKIEEFLIEQDYKKKLIENMWEYINTFNYNIFFLKDSDKEVSYYILEFESKVHNNRFYDDGNVITFIDIKQKKYKYKIINIVDDYFQRGYDLIKYDINDNENIINGINGKDEIKILCDMKKIKYAEVDVDKIPTSIKENPNKIGSFVILIDYQLNIVNYDEFSDNSKNVNYDSYIISNNLGELVNMLVYTLYEKINNISDVFFEKKDLTFIEPVNTIINKNIGIDLNIDVLDETTKKNIKNTLDFIKDNPESRQKYLLDNIKSFVKIMVYDIINKEIFKIMDEIKIKIKYPSDSGNKLTPATINDKFKLIIDDYKKNFKSNKLLEYIKDLKPSKELLYQEAIGLIEFQTNLNKLPSEQNKIIGSKCLNINNIDKLMEINNMNFRVLDSNGNTILIRLIEQYNIYGIEKLLGKKLILSTYKNNNMETPLNYLTNLLKNIQTDYDDTNFKDRIKKYIILLENAIKSSNQFDGIELSNSNDLVSNIITNSIYLFNETLWLKIYSYPSGWTNKHKKELKHILGINEEKLLINSFDSEDLKNYSKNIKLNLETKLSPYIKILENENKELENKSKEMEEENKTGNNFIKNSGYDIKEINSKIKNNENIICKYKGVLDEINKKQYDNITNPIKCKLDKYNDKLLDMKNLLILWKEYENLLNDMDDKYLKIIKILDDKCVDKSLISNHLIKIYNSDISDEKNRECLGKYFKLIYTPVFNDYWDLDRYEDSEYNTTNYSILQILKINVIGIIKNELINTLINFIIQLNKEKSVINDIIQNIKGDKGFKKSIQSYLYLSLTNKLRLNNPDKGNIQINMDELKSNIIETLGKNIGIQFDKTVREKILKIIEFNKFVCENIGFNCYEEITKILYDGKKISIYYEIYNLIYKAITLES
jgi:hypothetical protein